MMISRRPSPFGELLSLRQAMDRLFEDSYVRPPGAWSAGASEASPLALDVSTSNDALVIEAALPGVRPDDVDITVEDGTLTIRGQSRTGRQDREAESGYLVQEIRRGEFSRSVSLPAGLEPDRAEATFEDGILTLRIPRAEQVKPRQIRINPTSSSNGTQATDSDTSDQAHTSSSSSGERA